MFKFIVLTVLAYIIFRWLDRMFRVGGSSAQNRARPKASSGSKNQNFSSQKKTKSVIKDDVGEYVDYEELDEREK